MNLTLALPSLNRSSDETIPPLSVPSFNQILRFGKYAAATLRPSEFYGRFLWQGSLSDAAKRQTGVDIASNTVFASPVWQQMELHHMSLLDGSSLGISEQEAAELCDGLTSFYREDGWRFQPLNPALWLLTMSDTPDWRAPCILDVCGQIDGSVQAEGEGRLKWLRYQTEIQMWLHNHALNGTRSSNGLPPINGIWLWNDVYGQSDGRSAVSSDSLWARFSGTCTDAPYDFNGWLQMMQENQTDISDGTVFLDDLVPTFHTGDVWAYKTIMEQWEQRWFAPVLAALKTGRLKTLTVATDGGKGGTVTLNRRSLYGFWRRDKTFSGTW